jgi:hypothetical protein
MDPFARVDRGGRHHVGVHHVVQPKDLTFLLDPLSRGLPQFPTAFALGAIEPIPSKIGEIVFQRRL